MIQSRSDLAQIISLISPHRCPTRAQVVAWLERNGWSMGGRRTLDHGPAVVGYWHNPDGAPDVSDADACDSADWFIEISEDECHYSWPDSAVDVINELADMMAIRADARDLCDPGALCEEMLQEGKP